MQLLGSFYGLEQRAGGNRLFKIYATTDGIFGGWVAPCDFAKMRARPEIAQNAREWELYLDALVPGSDEFLAAHRENFAFDSSFTQASLTGKTGLLPRAATRCGALDVCLDGSKKRRFYLVGRVTSEEVAPLLQTVFASIQAETARPQLLPANS